MIPFLRISVFEEMRTIIVREAIGVRWEMRRDPVEDYAEAFLVKFVDVMHEIFRYAESARGGGISECLVAPRPGVLVLHYRQEIVVGEKHLLLIARHAVGCCCL